MKAAPARRPGSGDRRGASLPGRRSSGSATTACSMPTHSSRPSNGRYSPKGTRCTLSTASTISPASSIATTGIVVARLRRRRRPFLGAHRAGDQHLAVGQQFADGRQRVRPLGEQEGHGGFRPQDQLRARRAGAPAAGRTVRAACAKISSRIAVHLARLVDRRLDDAHRQRRGRLGRRPARAARSRSRHGPRPAPPPARSGPTRRCRRAGQQRRHGEDEDGQRVHADHADQRGPLCISSGTGIAA